MKKSLFILHVIIFTIGCSSFAQTDDAKEENQQLYYHDKSLHREQRIKELHAEKEGYIEKAQKYLSEKNHPKAIEYLEYATQVSAYDARPFKLLSQIHAQLGERDKFLQVLEKAGEAQLNSNLLFEDLQSEMEQFNSRVPVDLPLVSIAPFRNDKECAISFIFDDGEETVYTKAMPIFEAFGYRATFAINPSTVGQIHTDPPRGTWDNWRIARQREFEIANHSLNHENLLKISDEQMDREINDSYDIIREQLGSAPASFIFPFNKVDTRAVKKAREKHVVVRYHEALTMLHDNVFIPVYGGEYFSLETANKLVDMAVKQNMWLLPTCHGIEQKGITRTFKPLSEEFLRQHLSYIQEQHDDIWIDSFINVAFYLHQRNKTQITIDDQRPGQVVFTLKNGSTKTDVSELMTVVVNTLSEGLHTAEAVDTYKHPLPVAIKGKKLLMNVAPDQTPVIVRWR